MRLTSPVTHLSELTTCRVDEDEIDDRCDGLRKKLEEERKAGKDAGPDARGLKAHQVHDLAKVSDP